MTETSTVRTAGKRVVDGVSAMQYERPKIPPEPPTETRIGAPDKQTGNLANRAGCLDV